MQYTTIFIDLDDTLYPAGNGLWQAIKERIRQYMRERLGVPAQVVPELSHQYFLQEPPCAACRPTIMWICSTTWPASTTRRWPITLRPTRDCVRF